MATSPRHLYFCYTLLKGRNQISWGRDGLLNLQLNWNELFSMKEKQNENVEHFLDKFKDIFLDELGTMKNEKAKIYIKPNSIQKFLKACLVLYALKQRIEI